MGTEECFEAAALVGMGEAVQDDRVLTHVGVDVEEHLGPRTAEGGEQ